MSAAVVPSWHPRQVILRLALAAAALLSTGGVFGAAFVESCLPAYRFVFERVAGEFRIQSLTLDREGADHVVRVRVTLKPILVLDGKVSTPDPRGTANASTLMAHALLGPMLALLTAFAWPVRRSAEIAWRLLLAAPLAGLLVVIDVPCVLAAELWEIVIDGLAPNTFSPLVLWKKFLQGGGRQALGVAMGLAGVALSARGFTDQKRRPDDASTGDASRSCKGEDAASRFAPPERLVWSEWLTGDRQRR